MVGALLLVMAAQAAPRPATVPGGPADPAPEEPAPAPARAPASAAPAEPAAATTRPEPPATAVGLAARIAYRTGGAGDLTPRVGFSLGATIERRYPVRLGPVDLGAGADFFHDRFSKGVEASVMTESGGELPYDGVRLISHTSFAALQTAGVRAASLRAWVGLGAGVTVGYFSSQEKELRPGESRAFEPLLRAAVGLELDLPGSAALVLRGDYSRMLRAPVFTTDAGASLRIFGDLFDVGLGVGYRF